MAHVLMEGFGWWALITLTICLAVAAIGLSAGGPD